MEAERVITMLNKYSLLGRHDLTDNQLEKLILHDKKKTGTEIHFVFIHGIGKVEVEKIPVVEVLDFYKKYRDKKR